MKIELSYPQKKKKEELFTLMENLKIKFEPEVSLQEIHTYNLLIKGDNLKVMYYLLTKFNLKEYVDLVYIDPPFSTNNIYRSGKNRASSVSYSLSDEIAYSDKLKGAEYLEFLRERLLLIYELMAGHSSIYVHIDYKIGHYVKILMDEIFGIENFRNDITRIKCKPKNFSRKGYGNIKDMLLFYSKSSKFIFNEPTIPFTEEDIKRLFPKVDSNGRRYTTNPLHAPGETKNGRTGTPWKGIFPPKGRHWRYPPEVLDKLNEAGLIEWSSRGNPRKIIYADDMIKKGKRLQDVWEFKDYQYPTYPTEKNIDMLESIIKTSSNLDSVVFDCFCGSGTALLAAEMLGRRWIGIDNSEIAIETFIKRYEKLNKGLFNKRPFLYLKLVELNASRHLD